MADIQALIQKVYTFSCVGGHLHIVTDDENVRDSDLKFCSDLIDAGGYGADDQTPEEYAEQLKAERACCDALKLLTVSERRKAVRKFWE